MASISASESLSVSASASASLSTSESTSASSNESTSAARSESALPSTGDLDTSALSGLGVGLVGLALAGTKKRKKRSNK
ncbi:hypothetical protein CAC02_09035 [Streptococcus gallolyticus]|uniref:Gram-positive cocci surface proteins LPxTG domain-containing protein n=1 Tax=Streptococcus gallolyticus TaxID=315405 RepID=A0A368UBL9_9STRE|nr:hypothetical protein CAC02_09035 [Streptococcus gallolyticus]